MVAQWGMVALADADGKQDAVGPPYIEVTSSSPQSNKEVILRPSEDGAMAGTVEDSLLKSKGFRDSGYLLSDKDAGFVRNLIKISTLKAWVKKPKSGPWIYGSFTFHL